MAKLSRKKRQEQKTKQQNKLIAQGFSKKEVESLSNADLSKLSNSNIITQNAFSSVNDALKGIAEQEKQERRREQQRRASKKYREKKKSEREAKLGLMSEKIGLPLGDFKMPTAKWLDSHTLDEIARMTRTKLREFIPIEKLTPIEVFDFNKVYKVPNGKKIHFGYRALNGEKDIGDELKKFDQYTNEELLSYLKTIKEMALTGSESVAGSIGKRVGSSGQAGEGVVRMNSQPALKEFYATEYNDDRRTVTWFNNQQEKIKEKNSKLLSKSAKKKGVTFQHSAIDYQWQVIRQIDEDGTYRAYTEITPRKLLVIGNAILWNMRELDRGSFYDEFYTVCCEVVPEMKNILP